MADGYVLIVIAGGHRQRLLEFSDLREAVDKLGVSMRMPMVTECRLIRRRDGPRG